MNLPEKGIVTLTNWLMATDGERYMYYYSSHWQIVTDKGIPITDFQSRERWSLLASRQADIVAVFPGCQIAGFVSGDCPIKTPTVPHKADEPDTPPGVFNLDEGRGYK